MTTPTQHPDTHENRNTQERKIVGSLHPSFLVWLLHWASALLVLALIGTSLASGLGISKRLFPSMWMDWHLSIGVALFVITTIRLWTSGLLKILANASPGGWLGVRTVKPILLVSVFAAAISGLVIFQKGPLGRTGYVFGLFPMPTFIRLDHSLHNIMIDLHIALACVIFGLIIVHVSTGMRIVPKIGRSPFTTMLWPWRNKH